jgi:hypothetical protein
MRLCRFDTGAGARQAIAVRLPFPEGLCNVGDAVRIGVEGIGELRNTLTEEPDCYLAPETERQVAWAR